MKLFIYLLTGVLIAIPIIAAVLVPYRIKRDYKKRIEKSRKEAKIWTPTLDAEIVDKVKKEMKEKYPNISIDHLLVAD